MKFKIIFTVILLVHVNIINAQLCSGSMGDPVVNVTFGTGGYEMRSPITTYENAGGCPEKPGQYVLANLIFGCGDHTWVLMAGDHTGDYHGNFMMINAAGTPGRIHIDTARGLCGNTTYQFSAWITNVMQSFSCGGNPVLPNIDFTARTLSGVLIDSFNTGDIPITGEKLWKQFGQSFITPANVNDLILEVKTNPKNGCGSAFAIDDIVFAQCSQSTVTATIDGNAGPANVCADYQNQFLLQGSFTPGFQNPALQWQNSLDSGKSWADIPGANTSNYQIPKRGLGVVLYRMVVAENQNIANTACRTSSNIIYTEVHPLPEHQAPQNVLGCVNENLALPATDPTALQVLWSGPNNYHSIDPKSTVEDFQYADSGLYTLKETFYFGCVLLDSFYVTAFPGTVLSVSPGYPICEGMTEKISAVASGNVSYQWSPSNGLSSDIIPDPIAKPSDSTKYKLIVTNEYGCKDSAYVLINVYRNPVADAGPDKVILQGDTATLNGKVKGTAVNFSWTPSTFLSADNVNQPKADPPVDTKYTLKVVSAVGCGTVSDDVNVKVYKDFLIPNAFTPNGDGVNDQFKILTLDNYKLVRLIIYDRWGKLVFESENVYKGWDGMNKGVQQPVGTYVYYLELLSPTGKKITKKGSVMLIR